MKQYSEMKINELRSRLNQIHNDLLRFGASMSEIDRSNLIYEQAQISYIISKKTLDKSLEL